MKDFRDILVGVTLDPGGQELSSSSLKAVQQARWVAERTGGSLTLFHSSWGEEPASVVSGGALLQDGPAQSFENAVAKVCAALEADGIPTTLKRDAERPWLSMTTAAVGLECDLVVVAKREKAGPEGGRLGTNSHKLLRKCPCPVWVVHPGHELLSRSVLVATDLTDVGDRVLRLGLALASALDCELRVVHALNPKGKRAPGADADDKRAQEIEHEKAAARERIARVLAEVQLSSVEVDIFPGKPSEVILNAVDEVNPDLVVMGTVSRSGVAGLLVGNTAEKLLGRLDTSLLTVKPSGFVSPVVPS